MNYEVNGKVNAIKTDMVDVDEEETEKEEEENYTDDDFVIETTDEEEKEDTSTSNNSNKNNDLKKGLIKLMIIIGVGMLVLLLLLFLVSKIGSKKYTYESVEEVMKTAAESYFKDHTKSLPASEDQLVEIAVENLVAAEKMKDLDEYLGEGHGCTGKVQVKKVGDNYVYTPYLTCGDKYSTKFLAETIANDENLVGNGYGLYLLNNNYVYRGETVNNYLKLEAKLWRIVKVNQDKTITIILDERSDFSYPYDNRFNQQGGYEFGINNFQASRVREQLQKMMKTTDSEDYENYLLSDQDKTHIVNYDICVGKIGYNDTIHDNSIECTQTINDNIGMLTVSDYMNASIDPDCNRVSSESCQNYNYLGNSQAYWLISPSNQDTYTGYLVSGGTIRLTTTNEYNMLRPVITLASNTLISGGTGTETDPYVVK